MRGDESTLPESLEESILRAGFVEGHEALLVASLHESSPRLRVLALRGAARRALMTQVEWLAALADDDATVRREAAHLLAYDELRDELITSALRKTLQDSDPLVVESTVFALGEHGSIDALEQLCAVAIEHEDARCREAAVAALGSLGDDRGRSTILQALNDKPPVRRRAIVALANFEGPDIDAALERARDDRDWQVRSAVDQLTRDED